MSYTALYRKFRPAAFDEVKGQEHIVTTLKNQIEAERIGHAYLFCGTRGTGKTSIAKIFAKAVNCEHPAGGSPCPYDRVFATRLGAEAGRLILEGKYGFMVGYSNREMVQVPLKDVAGKLKLLDPDAGIIQEAKMTGISFGD